MNKIKSILIIIFLAMFTLSFADNVSDSLYRKAVDSQLIAAQNLSTTIQNLEHEIEFYKWLLLALLSIAGFAGFQTHKLKEELKLLDISFKDKSKIIDEEYQKIQAKQKSIEELSQTYNTELLEKIKDFSETKLRFEVEQEISQFTLSFPSQIFDNGLDFKNSIHQKTLKELKLKIEKLSIKSKQDYFYLGCECISTAIKNKNLGVEKLNEAKEYFLMAIELDENYFNAKDAIRYIHLELKDYANACKIATEITDQLHIRNKYTLVAKIETFLKINISEADFKILDDDLLILKNISYGDYWRLLIQVNLRKSKDNSEFVDYLISKKTKISEDNLGLLGKAIISDKRFGSNSNYLEIASQCFIDSIRIYEILKNKIVNSNMNFEKRNGDVNIYNSHIAANLLGECICIYHKNNFQLNEELISKYDYIVSLDNNILNRDSMNEIVSSEFILTKTERNLLEKLSSSMKNSNELN